ncbi:hypothetical protein ACEPAH_6123 [Sanghuangporus vaninii]
MVNNHFASPPPFDAYSPTQDELNSRDMEPPSYPAPLSPSVSHCPAENSEFAITLDDHHGKTWWTLRISSRSPNPKSLPTFLEGDPITGIVDLNLQRPDHIKAIIIVVKGLVVYSAYESKTFMEVTQTIWQSDSSTHNAWLPPGNYCWPFSLQLPPTIQLPEDEAAEYGFAFDGKLPPTLRSKEGHANIDYQITLRIKRSGLFHRDSKLSTLFGYCPATRSDPPSRLRALAYEENIPVIGPDVDREGWKMFPEIRLDGRLFEVVDVCISISLALPTPLSYPRGTAFPCALVLSSRNKQAIHLLSAPNALIVEMHGQLQTAIGESMVGGAIQFTEDDRVPFTKANWHPAEVHEANDVYTSTVLGELSLPPDLVPSFTLGKFECEYVVDVYPPEVSGFEPVSRERLFRTPVIVTTLLAPGPRPRAYLPPGYVASDSPSPERGIQRFPRADSLA